MPGKSLLSRSALKVERSEACLAWKFKTYSEEAFKPGKQRWIYAIEAVIRNDEFHAWIDEANGNRKGDNDGNAGGAGY